jgi:hypothetical protein
MKHEQNYHLLLKLHHQRGKEIETRAFNDGHSERFFDKPYNYLTPGFDIEEKIGPKFNSSF